MINFSEKELERAKKDLACIEQGIEKAVSSAINKTLVNIKTEAKKKIQSEYNIKSRDIEKTFKIYKANYSKLTGTVESKGHSYSAFKFITGYTNDRRIKVKIKKSRGTVIFTGKKKYKTNPFVATMGSGHTGIFQRENQARDASIKESYSLSIPQALGGKEVNEFVQEEGAKHLAKNLDREVERILRGYVKK